VVSGTDGLVEATLTPGAGANTVEVTGTTEALGTLVLTAEGT
jgi:hypothetical protein